MRAIGNNLVIKKIEESNQSTKGGLLLTEKQREDVRFQKAEVIKVGEKVVAVKTKDIILGGISLGSGIAIELAANNKAKFNSLFLISAYSSIKKCGKKVFKDNLNKLGKNTLKNVSSELKKTIPINNFDVLYGNNNIFDSEIQEDIGVSSIYGSLMGYNKLSVEAHDLNMYRENADKFEKMELETGTTFWGRGERKKEEAEGSYPLPPIPIPVTINKVYIDLIGEILKDLESGKIVGAIPIQEDELPAMIEY